MNNKNGRTDKRLKYKSQNTKPKHTFPRAFLVKQSWRLFCYGSCCLGMLIC